MSHDHHWRIFLQASEINAAWRCQRGERVMTEDLRQQLDKLSALMEARLEETRALVRGGGPKDAA